MNLIDIITQKSILPALKVKSKNQLIHLMCEKAAQNTGLHEKDIFETIIAREMLGSTGIGNGIAIPHGKSKDIHSIIGIFARLETPINFDSLDDEPVDLVFLLLAPETAGADHLKALSCVARIFRENDVVEKIRGTQDANALFSLLTQI